MNTEVMFSSKTEMWETPQDFFDKYDAIYHFTTDVCATSENAKCEHYYSPEENGLTQEWKGNCWCNPPYGKDIAKWIQKAIESSAITVMLLPARTDTKWFHELVLPNAKVEFIKGRLKFGGSKNYAPFPSMIAVFN